MSQSLRERSAQVMPPLVVGIAGLIIWEAALRLWNPDGFVLPAPTAILDSLVENASVIGEAARNTGFIVVTGLIAGVVVGVVMALLVSQFRLANETLTPLAAAIVAIPIIALAPIFNAWYGITSPRSNQAVVIVLVFFPIFINTVRGLTQVHPDRLELMRSYAASEWEIAARVRIPNALPYFFTALKIASSLAVISAIVAEYFGGPQDRLGPIIIQSAGLTRYADAWAAVLAGSLIGIALYFLAVFLEWLAPPRGRILH